MTIADTGRPQARDAGDGGSEACVDCGHDFKARPFLRGLRQRLGWSATVTCDGPAELDGALILSESCSCPNPFHTED